MPPLTAVSDYERGFKRSVSMKRYRLSTLFGLVALASPLIIILLTKLSPGLFTVRIGHLDFHSIIHNKIHKFVKALHDQNHIER